MTGRTSRRQRQSPTNRQWIQPARLRSSTPRDEAVPLATTPAASGTRGISRLGFFSPFERFALFPPFSPRRSRKEPSDVEGLHRWHWFNEKLLGTSSSGLLHRESEVDLSN